VSSLSAIFLRTIATRSRAKRLFSVSCSRAWCRARRGQRTRGGLRPQGAHRRDRTRERVPPLPIGRRAIDPGTGRGADAYCHATVVVTAGEWFRMREARSREAPRAKAPRARCCETDLLGRPLRPAIARPRFRTLGLEARQQPVTDHRLTKTTSYSTPSASRQQRCQSSAFKSGPAVIGGPMFADAFAC
jgi:hypothetical protein